MPSGDGDGFARFHAIEECRERGLRPRQCDLFHDHTIGHVSPARNRPGWFDDLVLPVNLAPASACWRPAGGLGGLARSLY
jgi:hypothetical protein